MTAIKSFPHRDETNAMYRILDCGEIEIVRIRVESKLAREEYELLDSYLEHLMQEVEPINFLCELVEGEGSNCQALWNEMSHSLRNLGGFQRIAVVGCHELSKGGLHSVLSWNPNHLKYFSTDQIEEAWEWLKD